MTIIKNNQTYYCLPTNNNIINFINNSGWVVVTADYRLAPAVVYEDIFEDVVDVYNWVRNDLVDIITGLDVSRFAVFGGSAGYIIIIISLLIFSFFILWFLIIIIII